MASLFELHVQNWRNCTKCFLHQTRQKVVFARGSVPADIALIGEAPWQSEDSIGLPFIGPAGKLIDKIVREALTPYRDHGLRHVFCNLVCCIPRHRQEVGEEPDPGKPGQPEDECVRACSPRLKEFMEIVDPRLIVCVGKLAWDWTDNKYRDSIEFHKNIPRVEIRHPSWILRQTVAMRGLKAQEAMVTIRQAIQEHILGIISPTESDPADRQQPWNR